jgi:hypothetical protein
MQHWQNAPMRSTGSDTSRQSGAEIAHAWAAMDEPKTSPPPDWLRPPDGELDYWARQLGCTREELRSLIQDAAALLGDAPGAASIKP